MGIDWLVIHKYVINKHNQVLPAVMWKINLKLMPFSVVDLYHQVFIRKPILKDRHSNYCISFASSVSTLSGP